MCFPCALPTALTLENNDASVSVRACVCQCVSVCAAGFCLNFLTEPLPDVEARRGLQRAVLPASSRHTAQPSAPPPPASQGPQNAPSACAKAAVICFNGLHLRFYFPTDFLFQV